MSIGRIVGREAVETTVDPAYRRTWTFTPMIPSLYNDGAEQPPPGPWDDEPDKIQWVDRATDLDCLMVRNHFGAWCGYVGVPRSHPLHGQDYNAEAVEVYAHGGLTFAGLCTPGEPIDGICHIAEAGREERPWWFGFDCAHHSDLHPLDVAMALKHPTYPWAPLRGTYRDEAYVINEVTDLARQLVDVR